LGYGIRVAYPAQLDNPRGYIMLHPLVFE